MTLHDRLLAALDGASPGELGPPVDRRDRFLALHAVYDLHLAPLEQVGDRARHQHHPVIAGLKNELERSWLAELEDDDTDLSEHDLTCPDGVRDALRDLASRDRLPVAYDWLAREATWEQLVQFLALEGGPDGGFDDLVALCQVGLQGSAKLELAQNYWDEMGNGDAAGVHTVLHQDLARAAGLPVIPRDELPVEALERGALNGLLATNRWLQPELLGALGMTELQAGPRCRRVLQGLERLGAPDATIPFYDEHARVDPRHGADWVEKAVIPLVAAHPTWGPRILRGACWRARTNLALFVVAHDLAAAWSPQRLAG